MPGRQNGINQNSIKDSFGGPEPAKLVSYKKERRRPYKVDKFIIRIKVKVITKSYKSNSICSLFFALYFNLIYNLPIMSI